MTDTDDQPIRRYFDPKGPNYVGSTESEVRRRDRWVAENPKPNFNAGMLGDLLVLIWEGELAKV